MADPTFSNKLRTAPMTPSGRCSAGLLLKSLFCAVFLFAIPIFPSEAPAFISETPFTNLWELLHLLFIGIAVSYGLFSRRNAEKRSETSELPEPYSSRMEGLLSIFDDGFHENGLFQYWDNGQSQGETFAFERKLKSKSFDFRRDAEIHSGHPENPEIHSWSSQYLQSPPVIMVTRPNYSPDADSNYKPLGLPVRSLRSRTAEHVEVKRAAKGGPDSDATCTVDSSFSSDGCKYGSFGEMGPLDLEEKFDSSVSLPSPIPWSSRLRSVERRKDSSPAPLKQSLHSSPLSVEESQFRHPKPWSVRSRSFASHGNSIPSPSPSLQSSSHSATPNLFEVRKEDAREKKRDQGPSQSSVRASSLDDGACIFFEPDSQHCTNRVSIEKSMPKNPRCGKDSSGSGIGSMHSHEYTEHAQKFRNGLMDLSDEDRHDFLENKVRSCGSLLQNGSSEPFPCSNNHSNYEECTRTSDRSSRREYRSNSSYGEGSVQGSMKLPVNSGDASTRASVRGKSVRTFRARDKSAESKTPGAVQQKNDPPGQSYPRKGEELGASDDELAFSKGDIDGLNYMTRPNTWSYPNHEEKKLQDRKSMESKEAELQAESDIDKGGDFDCMSEVDKKAGEFIAKFREQMRLQRTSIHSSSVVDAVEDHYQ
ncbi:hypothetical protein SAY86_019425 [Trapa natans]|uniref:Uncharacterized protein n=1 Tax=Trapa natans TaxID=22666 RepID=A0AAN7M0G1_TRANT|nr:hypothetical protein SAY86_019425 [Trapa natans]